MGPKTFRHHLSGVCPSMVKVLGPKNVPADQNSKYWSLSCEKVISEQQFITRWRDSKGPKIFSPKLTKGRLKLKK